MIRAIIQNGQIHPLDPLPAEWTEGHQLIVEDAESAPSDDVEEWYRELQELGPAQFEPGEWGRVQATLADGQGHGPPPDGPAVMAPYQMKASIDH